MSLVKGGFVARHDPVSSDKKKIGFGGSTTGHKNARVRVFRHFEHLPIPLSIYGDNNSEPQRLRFSYPRWPLPRARRASLRSPTRTKCVQGCGRTSGLVALQRAPLTPSGASLQNRVRWVKEALKRMPVPERRHFRRPGLSKTITTPVSSCGIATGRRLRTFIARMIRAEDRRLNCSRETRRGTSPPTSPSCRICCTERPSHKPQVTMQVPYILIALALRIKTASNFKCD